MRNFRKATPSKPTEVGREVSFVDYLVGKERESNAY